MRELHLFAGAGGGILGGILLGHTTVCAVEIEPYCREVLLQRQRDGILPGFPIWDDVRTFDGKPWRGLVDVVCGGFPCQDISCAGKGAGLDGERSGLWRDFARTIGEIRPRYAFVENSPRLTIRGLDRVLGDLANMGYDTKWGVFSCREVGGVHLRERIFILATNTKCDGRDGKATSIKLQDSKVWYSKILKRSRRRKSDAVVSGGTLDAPNTWKERVQGQQQQQVYRFEGFPWGEDVRGIEDLRKRPDLPKPLIRRIGHDVACGVDRISAIGNGQVPRVVALAWQVLSK